MVIWANILSYQRSAERNSVSGHDWIQTICAVLALAVAVYSLDPERRKQLQEAIQAVSSTLFMVISYLFLLALMCIYGEEIYQFGRSTAPMTRFEVLNLILNIISIGMFVWVTIYLLTNLGKGKKAKQ
jgi:uncharacterized membrane protein YidH (DUF202 family)